MSFGQGSAACNAAMLSAMSVDGGGACAEEIPHVDRYDSHGACLEQMPTEQLFAAYTFDPRQVLGRGAFAATFLTPFSALILSPHPSCGQSTMRCGHSL